MYIPCMVHASLAHKVPFCLAGKGCFEAINNLAHLKCFFCGHALFEANYRRFVNFNPICTFNRTSRVEMLLYFQVPTMSTSCMFLS